MGLCSEQGRFVRKFRLRYHSITDEEIANFIRIYLMYEPVENNCEQSDLVEFVFWAQIWKRKVTAITVGWLKIIRQGYIFLNF